MKISFLFIFFFVFVSCDSKNTSSKVIEDVFMNNVSSIEDYFDTNILLSSDVSYDIVKEYNSMSYRLKLIPIREFLEKKYNYSTDILDSLDLEMKEELMLLFEFKHDSEKDLLKSNFTGMDYDAAVSYMSFDLVKDFKLVNGKDTLNCSNCQIERNFNVAPFKRILLNFGGVDKTKPMQIIYRDNLFNNGIVKYTLTKEFENQFVL